MKKRSAFTFIEVIIAITVFAIGVLAVLRLITQNLATLDDTQTRRTATFLAKEGIELVYNMRDSNLAKWLPWDCILQANFATGDRNEIDPEKVCERNFATGFEEKVLNISFDPETYVYTNAPSYSPDFSQLWTDNRLFYTTGNVWWHDIFWYSSRPVDAVDSTVFSRYILFTGVREWSDILPRESVLKLESHVIYSKGSKTGEVVLESIIGNY